MNRTVEDYMGMPYTFEMWRAPEGGWVVRVKELTGCVSQGETAEEALAMIQEAMEGWLDVALEMGNPGPRSYCRCSRLPQVRLLWNPGSFHAILAVVETRIQVHLLQGNTVVPP